MTENEAIEILKHFNEKRKEFVEQGLRTKPSYFNGEEYQKFTKSIEMAIAALEEIQQYRALGTVEDFKNRINDVKTLGRMYEKLSDKEVKEYRELKTYKEIGTVEKLRELISKGKAYEQVAWERDIAISQLEEIGCSLGKKMGEAKEAVEKQRAKKPKFYAYNFYCSKCGNLVGNKEFGWKRFMYCDHCGQAIDFSEVE